MTAIFSSFSEFSILTRTEVRTKYHRLFHPRAAFQPREIHLLVRNENWLEKLNAFPLTASQLHPYV